MSKKSQKDSSSVKSYIRSNLGKLIFLSLPVLFVLYILFANLVYTPLTFQHLENRINEVTIPDDWEFVGESRQGEVNCNLGNCFRLSRSYKIPVREYDISYFEDLINEAEIKSSSNCSPPLEDDILLCSVDAMRGSERITINIAYTDGSMKAGVIVKKTGRQLRILGI